MSEQTVKDHVAAFFGGDVALFGLCTEQSEEAWVVIQEILHHDLTDKQTALLAAGPLETLLGWHGAVFIDRVEEEAARNPKFQTLLGGVWRHGMPEELWDRVREARNEVW